MNRHTSCRRLATYRQPPTASRRVLLLPPASSLQPKAYPGFTLIEMLVALAITMIMMGAVVALFGLIADTVSGSRSIIEMSERLRSARNVLQADLQGITATMKPPLRPENDEGYFELIEGPVTDASMVGPWTVSGNQWLLPWGDADDVLMFTTRSRSEPFVGKFYPPAGATTTESQVAEVIYFCVANGQVINVIANDDSGTALPQRLYTLYRRVLLVSPGLVGAMPTDATRFSVYHYENDVSARPEVVDVGGTPTTVLIPNSLGDLTKRENRFAHHGVFPFIVNSQAPVTFPAPSMAPTEFPSANAYIVPFFPGTPAPPPPPPALTSRFGDDVLLTNVLAFDVQVYDPFAPIDTTTSPSVALTPRDPGYTPGASTTLGAYVDLGSVYLTGGGGAPAPLFNQSAMTSGFQVGAFLPGTMTVTTDPPTPPAGPAPLIATYDTWSLHYENNGIDDDGVGAPPIDQGTDGLDSDNNGVVDDPGEFEAPPPIAATLRGIRVTIRVYEPGSQQVRQVSVVQDFLPD